MVTISETFSFIGRDRLAACLEEQISFALSGLPLMPWLELSSVFFERVE